jgi:putative nucleotidyltransferase with HDIG domain
MKEKVFKEIVREAENYIINQAEKNDWMWFYKMHQKEMVDCAEKLLRVYKADEKVVIIACWLHDITKYQAKNNKKSINKFHKTHHQDGCVFAGKFLKKYGISKEEIEAIAQCVLRHRNSPPFEAHGIEEKIVAAADVMSHFTSIFYLTYFKFYPNDSMEEMAENQIGKLDRDWRDLQLLPKARVLVEKEYKILRKLIDNYNV